MSTSTATPSRFHLETLTPLHWLGVLLAVLTGVLHLYLGIGFITEPLGWPFIAAGIGFFVGVLAVLVDYRRRLIYLLGVPFTGGQIVAWYVVNAPDFSTLGIGDKVVQVILIVVLLVLYSRES